MEEDQDLYREIGWLKNVTTQLHLEVRFINIKPERVDTGVGLSNNAHARSATLSHEWTCMGQSETPRIPYHANSIMP